MRNNKTGKGKKKEYDLKSTEIYMYAATLFPCIIDYKLKIFQCTSV